MKKNIKKIIDYLLIIIVVIFSLNCQVSKSQTYIDQDSVYGNWDKNSSPYIINSNIQIPINKVLQIESGVMILFNGDYNLTVYGNLNAQGVKGDSIIFSKTSNSSYWGGIRFESTNQPRSILSFVIVEKCGKWIDSSKIYDPYYSILEGGGVFISKNSKLALNNCVIRQNNAAIGGGICCHSDSLEISNTILSYNNALYGGAIYSTKNNTILGCLIVKNYSVKGGIITVSETRTLNVINCTVAYNTTKLGWGGVFYIGGVLNLLNSIVFYNKPAKSAYASETGVVNVSYCDIDSGANAFKFADSHHYTLNYSNNNIQVNPLFVNPNSNNFTLQESPCINNGSPIFDLFSYNYFFDLHGNIRINNVGVNVIDMGCFEYQDTIFNYPPVIFPLYEKYIFKNSKANFLIKYFDGDNDNPTLNLFTSDSNVSAKILDTLINGFNVEVSSRYGFKGDVQLYVNLTDNSGFTNGVYLDSVLLHIGTVFKGEISDMQIIEDTIQIIGDVTINKSGRLGIKPGAYLQFDNGCKMNIYGKFHAVGTLDSNIVFNAADTSSFYNENRKYESGWGGIDIIDVKRADTIKFEYCQIKNSGVKYIKDHRFLVKSNGTLNIYNSKNVLISNCNFQSNFATLQEQNGGVYCSSASNILVKDCCFSEVFNFSNTGAVIHAENSDIQITGSIFKNINSETNIVYTPSSKFVLKNSKFLDNSAYFLIMTSSGKKHYIENNTFVNNNADVVSVTLNDTLFVNNNLFLRNGMSLQLFSIAKVVGNIFAYNDYLCGCSNFRGGVIDISHLASTTLIVNNTFVGNMQDSNGDAVYASYTSPIILNNIFWQNKGDGFQWYNGYNGPAMGIPDPIYENNYSGNPDFEFLDSIDFRLKPSSNCINKGQNLKFNILFKDIYGNPRIDSVYRLIDIGAFEFPYGITNLYDKEENLDKLIWPNPASVYINISESHEYLFCNILDMNGNIVLTNSKCSTIDISILPAGNYIVQLISEKKYIINKKLVKL